MSKFRLFVSTCGTSIFLNSSGDLWEMLNRHANRTHDEIPSEDRAKIDRHLEKCTAAFLEADFKMTKKMSAELNGLLSYGDAEASFSKTDEHCLIVSDTYLGKKVGELLRKKIEQLYPKTTVQIQEVKDLVTNDIERFRSAMHELIQWCGDVVDGYRSKNYRVIFNLTGGFKSVQGFMQAIGMFYADESISVFQTGTLMRIPKLPIKLDASDVLSENLEAFRRFEVGQQLPYEQCRSISETLLFQDEGECMLSVWGELVWEQGKKPFLSDKLLDPIDRAVLDYGKGFKNSVKNAGCTPEGMMTLNRRIDELYDLLDKRKRGENTQSSKGLDFKPLKGNPKPPSTHECDVWSGQEHRIFGHFEGDRYILDELARGLH